MRTSCLALLCSLLFATPALADNAYKSVPSEAASHNPTPPAATSGAAPVEAGAAMEKSGLDLKVVSYDGAVNGELTVEVKNPGKEARTFTATGLYFVPDGKADEAPQRLGAVGPMQLAGNETRVEKLEIAPGKSVQVKLDVFCIDSHRPSPTSKNSFTIGSKRLPPKLRTTIESNAKRAVDQAGGYKAPMSKSRVQTEVWQARDAEWVPIDGEGKQETAKKNGGNARPQQGPVRIRRQPQRLEELPANVQNEAPPVRVEENRVR
jgi:hypothetical protein